MQRTRYVINGVEYTRLEDVPESYRELFADRDGDGVPDRLAKLAEEGRGYQVVRETVWQGRPEDIPADIRGHLFDGTSSEGKPTVLRREIRRPASPSARAGFGVHSPLEIRGWEPLPSGAGRLELRPGMEAYRVCWGIAGGVLVASLCLVLAGGWSREPLWLAVHGGLWLLALWWLVCPLWMRITLLRDDVHDTVWVRGMRALLPVRMHFPLQGTSLSAHAAYRQHRRSPMSNGWHWRIHVAAPGCKPLAAEIGFEPGRESPRRLPEHLRSLCREFATIFAAPVDVHVPHVGVEVVEPLPR
ncbi:MAG: hypothetical protein JXR77_06460 [Lentisphaeria bacterium]|nr:hypothetical protein [Lentisphaeria bacterium]